MVKNTSAVLAGSIGTEWLKTHVCVQCVAADGLGGFRGPSEGAAKPRSPMLAKQQSVSLAAHSCAKEGGARRRTHAMNNPRRATSRGNRTRGREAEPMARRRPSARGPPAEHPAAGVRTKGGC